MRRVLSRPDLGCGGCGRAVCRRCRKVGVGVVLCRMQCQGGILRRGVDVARSAVCVQRGRRGVHGGCCGCSSFLQTGWQVSRYVCSVLSLCALALYSRFVLYALWFFAFWLCLTERRTIVLRCCWVRRGALRKQVLCRGVGRTVLLLLSIPIPPPCTAPATARHLYCRLSLAVSLCPSVSPTLTSPSPAIFTARRSGGKPGEKKALGRSAQNAQRFLQMLSGSRSPRQASAFGTAAAPFGVGLGLLAGGV